jgi:hypothetical protein
MAIEFQNRCLEQLGHASGSGLELVQTASRLLRSCEAAAGSKGRLGALPFRVPHSVGGAERELARPCFKTCRRCRGRRVGFGLESASELARGL